MDVIRQFLAEHSPVWLHPWLVEGNGWIGLGLAGLFAIVFRNKLGFGDTSLGWIGDGGYYDSDSDCGGD